ncbi:MAG: putative solute-binding protein, partial [Rickettsiales bacterium]
YIRTYMMNTKMKLLMAATLTAMTTSSYAQKICVYDPLGSSGDSYSLMQDYVLAAKQWGADITLKPYSDEKLATADFKAGKCDGAAITGIRARAFNDFVGTISSPVGVLTNEQTRTVLALVANPKLASDMRSGDTEVAGVTSIGFAYIMVKDRAINTIPKLTTIKFGSLSFDKVQQICIEKFGGTSVPLELSEISSAFNSGKVGAIILPAIAFKPLEINKGMGTQGAIFRFPVALTTYDVLIHPDKFPDGYGVKSRSWFLGQLDRQMLTVNKIEKSIEPHYWDTIPANVAPGYVKILREARISLTKEGIYNKKMIGLLKKVRCRQDPNNYECPLTEE